MKLKIIYGILLLLFITSCNGNEVTNSDLEEQVELVDSLDVVVGEVSDSLSHTEVKEMTENLKQIEKKYGQQWGFCDCVIANDSVNEAITNTVDFEGAAFDKLMERSDFIQKKCQAFLSMDANKTPEERMKHEKKVRDCLKNK